MPLASRSSLLGLVLAAASACGTQVPSTSHEAPTSVPTLLALSTATISVGQPLDFFGAGFVGSAGSHAEVHFVGEYQHERGQFDDVDLRLRPDWADGNHLSIPYFGPFNVPFSPTGAELGTFAGTVTVINVDLAGHETESEPLDVQLEVQPSLILRQLQPLGASCDAPAKRLLEGYPYHLEVQAVGFQPVNYSYAFSTGSQNGQPTVVRRQAQGVVDRYGDAGELVLPLVGDGDRFYFANVTVSALGTDNIERTLSLDFGVHRPIEYLDVGAAQIAEIEAPQVMYSCMEGGDTNGRNVTYTETDSDTRTRSVTYNWDQAWMAAHSATGTNSHGTTDGVNSTNTQTDGSSWSVSPMIGGEIDDAVRIGISGSYGRSSSQAKSVGQDHSVNDTESTALTDTTSHNISKGESDFWSVSSAKSSSLAFSGLILPGEFGIFYRQTTRLAIPGNVISYNLCGIPKVAAQTYFFDYAWAVELAQGAQCPPFPKSQLPAPVCNLAPCSTGN
jgi:hypothetical protein